MSDSEKARRRFGESIYCVGGPFQTITSESWLRCVTVTEAVSDVLPLKLHYPLISLMGV